MGSSSRLKTALEFDHEIEVREDSFDHNIRKLICQFLRDVNVDFLIVVGPLIRIVTALKCLNKDIENFKDIEKYLNYQNQTRVFEDQITSLDGQLLKNNLIICEVPAVVEEECKNKLIEIIGRLETNHMQKAIFVNSEKTTLEEYSKNLGRGVVMQIDEIKRDVLLMYPDSTVDLYQASSAGDKVQVTKLLANGVEVNSRIREANNRTALHAAVEKGHKNVVLLLLAYGADVLIEDSDKQQPIDLAIKNGNDDIILRDIFKIDEKKERTGGTRLHVAVSSGETETAKILVKFGANINALDSFNYTPLYLAVCGGQHETARILVDLGADLNILCNDKTALDMAEVNCSSIFVNYLKWKGAKTGRQVKLAK